MGTYNSTTVGVFLEVDIVEEEIVEKYLVSPRTQKEFKMGEAQFCPESGMSLIEKERVHVENKCPNSFLEDNGEYFSGYNEEKFMKPQYVYDTEVHGVFLLNYRSKYSSSLRETDSYEIPENWKELKTEFEEEHKEYIELFKKEFGSCQVRYGVVNHAS
jgi:hypothetical protein